MATTGFRPSQAAPELDVGHGIEEKEEAGGFRHVEDMEIIGRAVLGEKVLARVVVEDNAFLAPLDVEPGAVEDIRHRQVYLLSGPQDTAIDATRQLGLVNGSLLGGRCPEEPVRGVVQLDVVCGVLIPKAK